MAVKRAPKMFAILLPLAMTAAGCATDKIKLEQGEATLANGETVSTNVFRQKGDNAGLGSTQVCLADPNALAQGQAIMQGCATTTGPIRGAVDAGSEVAGATAGLMSGAAFIKQAFDPVQQPVSSSGSSTIMSVTETANGALKVYSQTGPGRPGSGNQTNITNTGAIKDSNVQVIQGNTSGAAFAIPTGP